MTNNNIHDKIKELLSQYSDGVLTPSDRAEVAKHLASCPDCSRELAETKLLHTWLKQTPDVTPPPAFYDRVMRQIAAQKSGAGAKKSFPWGRPFGWAATALAAAVLILVVTDNRFKETGMRAHRLADSPAPQNALKSLERSAQPAQDKITSLTEALETNKESAKKSARMTTKYDAPADLFSRDESRADSAPARQRGLKDAFSNGKTKNAPVAAPAPAPEFSSFQKAKGIESNEKRLNEPTGAVALGGAAPKSQSLAVEGGKSKDRRKGGAAAGGEWRGYFSGIDEAGTFVIKDAGAWRLFWKRHAGEADPAPDVDFSTFMAVAVFQGNKTSGGHAVAITQIQPQADKIVIIYGETTPRPDAFTTTALTQPYHIKLIPQSPHPVQFQKAN
jgi:hypothetical protein